MLNLCQIDCKNTNLRTFFNVALSPTRLRKSDQGVMIKSAGNFFIYEQ